MKLITMRFKAHVFKTCLTYVDRKRLKKQKCAVGDLKIIKDIPYGMNGHPLQCMDILSLKEHAEDAPLIINIHGGGLIYGDKELNQNFNGELVRRGFRVVSLSYRLLPNVSFVDQVQDIFTALAFIRENAKKYALRLDKMIIVGDSAGGLLTLFVIALSRKEELRLLFNVLDPMLEIKGMVLISSMLEIGNRKDIIDYARTLVLQEKNHPAEAYIYEPSKLFGEIKFPPSFLVTSSEDFIRNDSLKIRSLLQASNTTFECLDWDKGKNYKLNHVFTVTYPTYQESQKTLDAMVSFLDQVC